MSIRIWNKSLIPKLCRQHLLACWRETLGAYAIITQKKKGYRNHPAVKEFEHHPLRLWYRLQALRMEMVARGYNPKDMPAPIFVSPKAKVPKYEEWQTLDEQIEVLKGKGCACNV